jgi:hypothetical protein
MESNISYTVTESEGVYLAARKAVTDLPQHSVSGHPYFVQTSEHLVLPLTVEYSTLRSLKCVMPCQLRKTFNIHFIETGPVALGDFI